MINSCTLPICKYRDTFIENKPALFEFKSGELQMK